jgi:hypothetical protein
VLWVKLTWSFNFYGREMREILRDKIVAVCDEKIAKKGPNVGLSFYAFFANKNDNPELLMEAAEWWIRKHQLDHFEKAVKIKKMVQQIVKS